MNERALEIKVGVFVLAAAAILAGFALALGDLSFSRGWEIHVDYGFVGSVHEGAPVRVSGLEVGRVRGIELLDGERRDEQGRPLLVRLRLDLDESARGKLREDTEFHIGAAGVLGEVYVEAVTGSMH
ncbi:MAG: MlaD family protein, partial [Myxococcota bacterium]